LSCAAEEEIVGETSGTRTLFAFRGTPVEARPDFFVAVLFLWGLMTWRAGRRRWPTRLLAGALAAAALLAADVGHALAHVVSADHAGAPVDHIFLAADMPRTRYPDEPVLPRTHRLRALGGPIYSAAGLVASLLARLLAPRGTILRGVLDWSVLGHGLILAGSLLPLPIVDGGTFIKWTLVERGHTPEEADAVVRRAGLGLGAGAVAAAAGSAARRRWWPALGLLVGGAVAIAAALGRLR
jgi:hypothetical protein